MREHLTWDGRSENSAHFRDWSPMRSRPELVQLLPAVPVQTELQKQSLPRGYRNWMLPGGKIPPQSPSPQLGSGLLSVGENWKPYVFCPQPLVSQCHSHSFPYRWTAQIFTAVQDGEEAFFHICNLSQAPKAVPGNCFEIHSIIFHCFSGNFNWFEAAQRKRADNSRGCAQNSTYRVQVLIAESCS